MRNKTLVFLLTALMICSAVGGGLLVNYCNATDEDVAVEPTTEVVEETTEPTQEEVTEPTTEPTTEVVEETKELTQKEIVLRDTKLSTIDFIKLIDKSKNHEWYAYYIHSDGDIYVVTIRGDHVDVCCMLN